MALKSKDRMGNGGKDNDSLLWYKLDIGNDNWLQTPIMESGWNNNTADSREREQEKKNILHV